MEKLYHSAAEFVKSGGKNGKIPANRQQDGWVVAAKLWNVLEIEQRVWYKCIHTQIEAGMGP